MSALSAGATGDCPVRDAPYGKHRGELLTRVPVSYLEWMANNNVYPLRETAVRELTRRGVPPKEVNISLHAIDRASLRVAQEWRRDMEPGEGLYSWLCRVTLEAKRDGYACNGAYYHKGLRFIIEDGAVGPTLVTIMKPGDL